MITISFPGIGIDSFSVNPVAFSIGSLEVRWYGIIITLGIIFSVFYCSYRAKQEGISYDDLLDMAIFTIPIAVIGARLYYVVFDNDHTYTSFMDVISIWNGGIAIYGAIIAGALTILCVCLVKKIKIFRAFDMVSPAVMLGQIIGRWGNFMNGEAHGSAIEEGSIFSFIRMGLSYRDNPITNFYHPTFLYESVWNLIGFVIINLLYKKKKFDGQVFFMYISWYGFGRAFIELLRTDSLGPNDDFRISHFVAAACFVVVGWDWVLQPATKSRHRISSSVKNFFIKTTPVI